MRLRIRLSSVLSLLAFCAVLNAQQPSTTTTLQSSANPSIVGQFFTLTATVSSSTATGTVTFFDGTTNIGTGSLSVGTATLNIFNFTAGSHSLTATYGGDTNFLSSTSAPLIQVVNPVAATISFSATPGSATFGQPVSLLVYVYGPGPNATGNITFFEGTTSLGTVTLNSGSAQLNLTSFAIGSHSLTASYSGDTNYLSGTSAASVVVVGPAPTVTRITAGPTPVAFGSAVTMKATVLPLTGTQVPGGTVSFYDGDIKTIPSLPALATVALASGSAQFTTSSLSVGTHTLSASYSSDNSNAGSTSASSVSLTFLAPIPGTIGDYSGNGTGFTTRLPGTGTSLGSADPNIYTSQGVMSLSASSSNSNLNGGVNLGSAEFIGMPLADYGITTNQDFSVSATFTGPKLWFNLDQFGLFAGTNSTLAFRGGLFLNGSTATAYTVQTVSSLDTNLQSTTSLVFSSNDTLVMTLSRTAGVWAYTIQNTTTGAPAVNIPITQPAYLNNLSTLVAGIYVSSPNYNTFLDQSPPSEAVSQFSVTGVLPAVIVKTASTVSLKTSANPSISRAAPDPDSNRLAIQCQRSGDL